MSVCFGGALTQEEAQFWRTCLAKTENARYPSEAITWVMQNTAKVGSVLAMITDCVVKGEVASRFAVLCLLSDIILHADRALKGGTPDSASLEYLQKCVYAVLPDVMWAAAVAESSNLNTVLKILLFWKSQSVSNFPPGLFRRLAASLVHISPGMKDIVVQHFFDNEADLWTLIATSSSYGAAAQLQQVALNGNAAVSAGLCSPSCPPESPVHAQAFFSDSGASAPIPIPAGGQVSPHHNGTCLQSQGVWTLRTSLSFQRIRMGFAKGMFGRSNRGRVTATTGQCGTVEASVEVLGWVAFGEGQFDGMGSNGRNGPR